jgi:hypothetical protein
MPTCQPPCILMERERDGEASENGDEVVEDVEGTRLLDLQSARRHAVLDARELLAHAIHGGQQTPPDCVVVVNAEGRELLTVFTTEVLPASLRKQLR